MKNPVLKNQFGYGRIPSVGELLAYMNKHNLSFPVKIPVSFREGKRKKLKSTRFHSVKSYPCDLCGEHRYLTYEINGKIEQKEVF